MANPTSCWRAGAAEVKRLFEDLGHPLTDQKLFDVMERFDAAGTVQFLPTIFHRTLVQPAPLCACRFSSHDANRA